MGFITLMQCYRLSWSACNLVWYDDKVDSLFLCSAMIYVSYSVVVVNNKCVPLFLKYCTRKYLVGFIGRVRVCHSRADL